MDLLIYFTNLGKLQALNHENMELLKNLLEEFGENNPFYSFSNNEVMNKLNGNMTEKVILCYDLAKEEKLKEEFKKIKNYSRIFLIHHSNPEENVLGEVEKAFGEENKVIRREGMHAEDKTNPKVQRYMRVMELLGMVDNPNIISDQIDKIIKELSGDPILEAKLNLLHQCLDPNGINDIAEMPEQLIEDLNQFKKTVDINFSSPLNQDYINALSTLRDKWLT